MRSTASIPFQGITIKPQPEVIQAIYQQDFTQADRDLFIAECKDILKHDALRYGQLQDDIFIYRVGVHLHERWLQLCKVSSELTLESSEDFYILQYLLGQRPALVELNRKFNTQVINRAAAFLQDQSNAVPASSPLRFINWFKSSFNKIHGLYISRNARRLIETSFILACLASGMAGGIWTGIKLGIMVSTTFPTLAITLGITIGGFTGTGLGSWLADKAVRLAGATTNFQHDYKVRGEVPVKSERQQHDTCRISLMMTEAVKVQKRAALLFQRNGTKGPEDVGNMLQSIQEKPEVSRFGIYFNSKNKKLLIWSKYDKWEHYPTIAADVPVQFIHKTG